MLLLNDLPTAPVSVPVYRPTGSLVTGRNTDWGPDQSLVMHFAGLEPTGQAVPFDPSRMTADEVRVASPSAGRFMFGLLAAPFRLFLDAWDRRGETLVMIEGQPYQLMLMFGRVPTDHEEPVVAGAYTAPSFVTGD